MAGSENSFRQALGSSDGAAVGFVGQECGATIQATGPRVGHLTFYEWTIPFSGRN